MAACYCYCLGIKSNDFFLKDNKKAFILWLNVPKVTAYNYQDMRGGYDKLCGVIRSLGEDPEDGTAYVFTSKDQKIVKIIRHEHNECQMYYQKFDKNMSFVRLEFEGVLPIYVLEWKYLVAMLSCPVVKSIGPIELKCYEEAA